MGTRVTRSDRRKAYELLANYGFANPLPGYDQANIHSKLIIFQQHVQQLTQTDDEPFDLDYRALSEAQANAMLGATLMLDPAATEDQRSLGEDMLDTAMDRIQLYMQE